MKLVTTILGIAILAAFTAGCTYFKKDVNVFAIQEIDFQEIDEAIYLKHKARGLNYEVIVISPKKKRGRKPNSDREYVYTWDETLFFKKSQDTLYVYCSHKAKTPSEFKSDVVIVQKQYSNPEFVYQFKQKYIEMGLERFPED